MAQQVTVWVTTPVLPDAEADRWMDRVSLEGRGIEVRTWGSDGDGRGIAVLRLFASSATAAVEQARQVLDDIFGDWIAGADLRTTPGPDDLPDFDIDEAEQPLRWIRQPVRWDACSVGDDPRLLRIHYIQAGTVAGPGAAIAEVVLSEEGATVSVTLFERDLAGTYPDGAGAGRALAAVSGCLQVRLQRPLGQRRVIDGSTGIEARRLDEGDEDDRDRWQSAVRRGCPIWEP